MNKYIKTGFFLLLIFFLIQPQAEYAEESKSTAGTEITATKSNKSRSAIPPAKEPDIKNDPEAIKMNADRLLYDDNANIARLRGNVKITYGEMVMTSKYAIFYGKTKQAFFTGGVKLYKPGTTVTGEKMDVYYNEQRAVINENVRGVTYQKLDEKEPGKKKSSPDDEVPLILTCRQAECFWEHNEIYANGDVKVWKNDRRAYSDEGHYSQDAGTVILTDNVRFEQGAGNWMTCPEAIFDLNAETFDAKGGVEAELEVSGAEEGEDKDSKDSKSNKKEKTKKDSKKEQKQDPLPEDRVILPPVFPEEDDEVIFSDDFQE